MDLLQNKRGALAWQYIVAIILGLIVLVVIIIFSGTVRENAIEGIKHFMEGILGR